MASSDIEEFTLSKEESERLKEAFKDEKFVRLLHEYAEEVNDPENRKKYEEDVIAVEKQHGHQVTFIHQEAGYVIKTSEEGEKKAFVNVCQNDKVEKPSFTRESESDAEGTLWKLPHLLTPPRQDLDKSNRRCVVYDVVFHPDALLLARKNERFRKMLDDVALEAVESKFDVKLDRANVRFPKMKYKGCPVAPVTRKKMEASFSPKDSEDDEFDDRFEELFRPPKSSFDWSETKKKKKSEKPEEAEEGSRTRPKYTVKYRNRFDIQDYANVPGRTVDARPQEIIVEIHLPLLSSASDLNLDIFEKRLLLISEKKGASYKLDLALPYSVNENDGKAQFDKAKRKLCITLKVLPSVDNLDTTSSGKIGDNLDTSLCDKLENTLDASRLDKIDEDLELKEQIVYDKTAKDFSCYSLTVDNMDNEEEFEKISIDLIENSNILDENNSSNVSASIRDIAEMNDITERFEGNLHVDEKKQENGTEKSQMEETIQEKRHDCDLNMPLSLTVPYSIPKFDYYQTSKIVTLVIQVKNIDSSSIYTYFCDCRHSCRVTFYTLGEGFVPFYYCLFLKFEYLLATNTETMRVSLSRDNLVFHLIKDANYCYSWTEFQAGLNNKQLTKYEFVCKNAVLKTIQELKDESENVMAGDKLTNENVHVEDVSLNQVTFDINLKQSVQDQIEKEINSPQDAASDQSKQDMLTIMNSSTKLRTSSGSSEDQNQSPLQKKRGILKYPRCYWRTISESSDDTFWSSLDNDCTPVGSFDSSGEKPKKCVRFSDQIAKTVFRANSSILGQRKKNQRKARNRKKMANRTSESDNCTETSEENSDYNSTNESELGPDDLSKYGRKLYTWQENKNADNTILDVEKIQLSKNEFDKKEQLSVSSNNNCCIESQCENNNKMTMSKSSQQFTFGLKENQKITIMQRPSSAANFQKPIEKSSGISNFVKSHCLYKPGEKRNDKGSQKGDNPHGETKQKNKFRKRRRWRNKKNNANHLTNAPASNQLLEQNILKRNNNRISKEEGGNWIYDNKPKYYNNNNAEVANKAFENCNLPNAFWMCNQSAEFDPQYRTKCMVNFANQVMFQLD
ncbi:protein kintoun-like isoform X1 [Centruroides sculpturatus]|uniref:protein kintoun-like isoform X1 n=1 Tax=Centruroides sculpturatus TaxID=218467 RepID=UPI000C6D1434|nr:protein kintoun-like isoform X1 [Centruroides sculpturatus]